jgi:uncharacterized protein (TIGR00299 family) protein
MSIVYFDCFSGISGDMTLGALVDAGVPIAHLRTELGKLGLSGYSLSSERVFRAGIAATRVKVELTGKAEPERGLDDIRQIVNSSALTPAVKQKSLNIFRRLAEAEAAVHMTTIEEVHFHEVGAIDAIVDIVGSVIGLESLGVTDVVAGPLNLGSGTARTMHGNLPVPAPATSRLLEGAPAFGSPQPVELTTPTGAAIISTLASSFGAMPQMKLIKTGYGAGGRDLPNQPNVLRLMLGELFMADRDDGSVLIETNIDDMSPQVYDHLIEILLARGAKDVWLTPIIMKKGRPAVLLSVLCGRSTLDRLADTLFRETTSIGLRIHEVGRKKLARTVREIDTRYGKVRVKVSSRDGEVLTATPEYEDCKRLAEEQHVPLKLVMEEARAQFSAFKNEETT